MSDYETPPGITKDQCLHLDWCLKEYGQVQYVPTLAGNALFLGLFLLGLLLQIGLGIRHKTWGYMVAMFGGIALEIIGYVARIELHNDIFNNNYFIIYLVGLTLGPAFFSAAIYLSLSRIIALFGSELSWLKPKTITIMFVGFDFFSLVLQAAGGALASTADTHKDSQTGINIMIAGLSTQVASTTAFCVLCGFLAWAIRRHPEKLNQDYSLFRKSMRFRLYLLAIAVATVVILLRCTYRVAELSEGFDGDLANNEPLFMILDGAMMIICVICLTAAHPGLILGSLWDVGAFHWRSEKSLSSKEMRSTSPNKTRWNIGAFGRRSKRGGFSGEKNTSPSSTEGSATGQV